uniref:Uncharacterized protein n=1 Tax=Tanacetum cinerariifolium TaxID=118510 RepID=A0A6L2KKQ0_TANCI|nr:hypothetical protein [Tanacetum cinerariifolium]
MVDDLLSTRIRYATRTDLESYTKEFGKKAQEERKLYIDVVEKSSTINESLKNVILAKSSSQPKSTYEAAESLTKFKLKKILLDKMKRSTKSQPKSSGKSIQAEEPVFEIANTEMPQNQGGDTKDQPNPQKWISNIAKASRPPRTFDELMSTLIDFLTYVIHNLKIDSLTQEILVGHAFNLLKGTCKSFVELEHHFEECYKVVTAQLDWNNPEGQEYPFDLSKPLPKYTTSTTKTKAVKYDNIKGIKDMVPTLWSPVKKKLNLTKPETFRSDISKMTPYTTYKNPQGIIYQDKFKRKWFMRSDKLYKFCDSTLTSVRRILYDIANNLTVDYLPKRRWSNLDRISQNQRDLPRDIPLDSVKVLSAAAKPCQGDSSEFNVITGSNPDGRSYWIKMSQDSKPHAHT